MKESLANLTPMMQLADTSTVDMGHPGQVFQCVVTQVR